MGADQAVISYINQMVQWPVYGRVQTLASESGGENDFAVVDFTPKGTFKYLLVREVVLSYSSNAAIDFNLFSDNGGQVYASVVAQANGDVCEPIPVWQLESSKIFIRTTNTVGGFDDVHFVVFYQEIYNDQSIWMNINMKHTKAMKV